LIGRPAKSVTLVYAHLNQALNNVRSKDKKDWE